MCLRRDYKIKFSDKLKANLWVYLVLAKVHRLKELTSPYIVSYFHFLNLNNILALPKLLPSLKLRLIWHDLRLPCFLPARFRRMRASLRNQSKCKPSMGPNFGGFGAITLVIIVRLGWNFDTASPHKYLSPMWRILNNSIFSEGRTYSKFAFLVQVRAKFTPWRSSKSKKTKYFSGKNLSIVLSKYRKIKAVSRLNFQ